MAHRRNQTVLYRSTIVPMGSTSIISNWKYRYQQDPKSKCLWGNKCAEDWNKDCSDRKYHDDVIEWKHFPRYWSFVRGIPRSPVNSPRKGHWCGPLMFSLILRLNRLCHRHSKQWWGWLFGTLSIITIIVIWSRNITCYNKPFAGLFNTLSQKENGHTFAGDIFIRNFLNKNVYIDWSFI